MQSFPGCIARSCLYNIALTQFLPLDFAEYNALSTRSNASFPLSALFISVIPMLHVIFHMVSNPVSAILTLNSSAMVISS